jgi:hypothetical protein
MITADLTVADLLVRGPSACDKATGCVGYNFLQSACFLRCFSRWRLRAMGVARDRCGGDDFVGYAFSLVGQGIQGRDVVAVLPLLRLERYSKQRDGSLLRRPRKRVTAACSTIQPGDRDTAVARLHDVLHTAATQRPASRVR